MWKQLAGVRPRQDDEAAVLAGHGFQSRPSRNNLVGRSKREIEQILMQRMSAVHTGRLVDEHRMNREEFVADERLETIEKAVVIHI